MNTSDRITEYVFSDYVELTKKECLKWIVIIIIIDCLFLLYNINKVYRILTVIFSVLLIAYLLFLIINKQRMKPQSRFLCEGLVMAHLAFQFDYVAYRLFCGGGNIVLLISLLILLLMCGVIYALYVKKKVFSQSSTFSSRGKSKSYAFAGAFLGYLVARALLPSVDEGCAVKVAATCALTVSLLLSFCSERFLKVIYIYKYNVNNSSSITFNF